MALVYVGGTTGGGTGASYTVSLNGTLTGGSDSSPSQGDIVLVAAGHGATASSAPTCSGNTMGAYTGVHNALYSNDTWDTNFRTFYMIQGATPDITLTIARTNNTTYGGATAVHVWRNVDQSTPIDITPTTNSANNQSASRPDAPVSNTPTMAGAIIIAAGTGMQTTAGSAFTIPANMTNGQSAFFDGSTSDAGTFIASAVWTSGTFNPDAVTGGTTSTSGSHASTTFALRPSITQSTVTHTTDSYLVAAPTQVTKTHTTDSALLKTNTLTHTTDSYLAVPVTTNTLSHTTDSYLYSQQTKTHTTDALKYSQNTKTHTSDSALKKTDTKTHTTDAYKYAQVIKTHTSDSYLYSRKTATHTTDSYLEASTAQFTVSHTTDSTLKATKTVNHTTSSALQKTDALTHTTSSALKATNTQTHTTDTYLRATTSLTHTTDSALKGTLTAEHTTDSYLVGGALTVSHSTDSLLARVTPEPRTIINIETGEVLQRVGGNYYIAL
jgi:hypothetical protein